MDMYNIKSVHHAITISQINQFIVIDVKRLKWTVSLVHEIIATLWQPVILRDICFSI